MADQVLVEIDGAFQVIVGGRGETGGDARAEEREGAADGIGLSRISGGSLSF
jgi:hypothetical protein